MNVLRMQISSLNLSLMILVTGPGIPSPIILPPISITGVTSADVFVINAS